MLLIHSSLCVSLLALLQLVAATTQTILLYAVHSSSQSITDNANGQFTSKKNNAETAADIICPFCRIIKEENYGFLGLICDNFKHPHHTPP